MWTLQEKKSTTLAFRWKHELGMQGQDMTLRLEVLSYVPLVKIDIFLSTNARNTTIFLVYYHTGTIIASVYARRATACFLCVHPYLYIYRMCTIYRKFNLYFICTEAYFSFHTEHCTNVFTWQMAKPKWFIQIKFRANR